jgi:predicted nucleic acid-binding protein
MAWIIDTDLLVEGERGDTGFVLWLESADEVATAEIIRAEFLPGVHAVNDDALKKRGLEFYSQTVARLPSLSSEPSDYARAAELAGRARRSGRGSPGLVDGLIAALALRTSATVATRNTRDLAAMNCPCFNPLATKPWAIWRSRFCGPKPALSQDYGTALNSGHGLRPEYRPSKGKCRGADCKQRKSGGLGNDLSRKLDGVQIPHI